MSTNRISDAIRAHSRLSFWACVVAIYLLVLVLGWDQEITPWLHARFPPRTLLAYRIGYAAVGGGVLALLMRRRYGAHPLLVAGIGFVAGYLGGLIGNIFSEIALGPGVERLLSLFDSRGGSPLLKIGLSLALPLISPGWLWTTVGSLLGAVVLRFSANRSEAGAPH